MPSLRTLAVSAILLASLAPAAAAAQQTPTQTVQAFYDAVRADRWAEVAALVTPQSAARYQRDELNQMAFFRAHQNRAGALRLDTMSAARAGAVILSDPLFPRDASAMDSAHDSITVELISGARSIGELRAMPPEEFLTRALEQTGGSMLSITSGQEPGQGTPPSIVGHVIEHDTAAFVLYRKAPSEYHEGPRPDGEGSVETLYLKRDRGRWRLLLTSAITPSLGMGLALEEVDIDAAPGADSEP